MGKFDGVLFASDMDGTLLGWDQIIPEENRQAIEYFQSEGGRFTIATGRGLDALDLLTFDLGAPFICMNGAALMSEKPPHGILWEKKVDLRALARIHRFCRGNPAVLNMGIFGPAGNRFLSPEEFADPRVFDGADLHKFNVTLYHPEDMAVFRPQAEALTGNLCQTNLSWDNLLEFLPIGGSKGEALSVLAKMIPDVHRVVAAGDYENDLSLLAHADISFAPENAIPAVQALATRLVRSHRDGAIAHAIELLEKMI